MPEHYSSATLTRISHAWAHELCIACVLIHWSEPSITTQTTILKKNTLKTKGVVEMWFSLGSLFDFFSLKGPKGYHFCRFFSRWTKTIGVYEEIWHTIIWLVLTGIAINANTRLTSCRIIFSRNQFLNNFNMSFTRNSTQDSSDLCPMISHNNYFFSIKS